MRMIENMRKFSNASKFVKCITSLAVGFFANKDDLELLKIAFQEIDTDEDGIITQGDLYKYQDELICFGTGELV